MQKINIMDNVQFRRLLDKENIPSGRKISDFIDGRIGLWNSLKEFLKENYEFQPELNFFGKKYGWCYRYRRKGKTLCVLFPESNAFTVLVVLGKNEIERFKSSKFNKNTKEVFKNAYQYFDGKWMYKRVVNESDLKDIKNLIVIKKKPMKINKT